MVENTIQFHELHAMTVDELISLRDEKGDVYDKYKNAGTPFGRNQLITVANNLDRIETVLDEKGAWD